MFRNEESCYRFCFFILMKQECILWYQWWIWYCYKLLTKCAWNADGSNASLKNVGRCSFLSQPLQKTRKETSFLWIWFSLLVFYWLRSHLCLTFQCSTIFVWQLVLLANRVTGLATSLLFIIGCVILSIIDWIVDMSCTCSGCNCSLNSLSWSLGGLFEPLVNSHFYTYTYIFISTS